MEMIKYVFGVILFSCVGFGAPAPYAQFIIKSGFAEDSNFLSFETDLDEDLIPEVWISEEGWLNGAAENIWQVFVFNGETYSSFGGLVSLRSDALSLHKLDENRITTYWPNGARQGRLIAFELGQTNVQDIDLGEISSVEGDREVYDEYFEKSKLLDPVEFTLGELSSRVSELESAALGGNVGAGIQKSKSSVVQEIKKEIVTQQAPDALAEIEQLEHAEETERKSFLWLLLLLGGFLCSALLGIFWKRSC